MIALSPYEAAEHATNVAGQGKTIRTVVDWLSAEVDFGAQCPPEFEKEAAELCHLYELDLILLTATLADVTTRVMSSARIREPESQELWHQFNNCKNFNTLLPWSELEIAVQRNVLATKPQAANKHYIDLYDHFVNEWALPMLNRHAGRMQQFRLRCEAAT